MFLYHDNKMSAKAHSFQNMSYIVIDVIWKSMQDVKPIVSSCMLQEENVVSDFDAFPAFQNTNFFLYVKE